MKTEDIKSLVEGVRRLDESIDVEKAYNWKIPDDCPITTPANLANLYDQNVFLKKSFAERLSSDVNTNDYYWIINSWGGIKTFKRSEKNNSRIQKFKTELAAEKLSRDSFNVISSLSKLAAFQNPDTYSIYDSRAIYSLNWLILKYCDSNLLFPQPAGRNSTLSSLNLENILNLAGIEYSKISYQYSFFQYCDLLKLVSLDVFQEQNPQKVEMLLFMAAPIEIADDVKKSLSVSLELNKSVP